MANYTINNLPNTVTEINSADTLAVWDSANSKTAKINGSNLSKSILSNLVTISASSTTVSGLPIKRGSCVKILFTTAITGSDTSTAMAITYNGTSIPVKVGKQGSLSNFVAHEINSAYYYLQAYTTLELIFDGTQFIIVGNPVVLSSSDYTIYADGLKVMNNIVIGSITRNTSITNNIGEITAVKFGHVAQIHAIVLGCSITKDVITTIATTNLLPYNSFEWMLVNLDGYSNFRAWLSPFGEIQVLSPITTVADIRFDKTYITN